MDLHHRADEPLLMRFDSIACIPISTELVNSGKHELSVNALSGKISKLLNDGLGDRIHLLNISSPKDGLWPLDTNSAAAKSTTSLLAGFLVDPNNASRTVDQGPSATDKEACAAYREFWGPKAELRRFKDGSIVESLIWSESDSKLSILEQIVVYLLNRHVGEGLGTSVVFYGGDLVKVAPEIKTGPNCLAPFQPIMAELNTLEQQLRDLEGLPLHLRQIVAASSSLSFTSYRLPCLRNDLENPAEPANIVMQFEGSSRWPEDIVAIQRTKIAFLLKISALLEESVPGLTARVGLENKTSSILNISFLDILTPGGAAFRLRIDSEREQLLLQRSLQEKSLDRKSKEEAASTLAAYRRNFIHTPRHAQAMRTLCTRHPLLSPTVRLVKKWFGAHLLSNHFPEKLIEIFVVRVFVQPDPWETPSSLMTGFLRTLLFVSRWDWRLDPLAVDFSGEMPAKDLDPINLRFEAWRKVDPALNRLAMFVATSYDPSGTTWTERGPRKVIAARMTALAKSACALVQEEGLGLDLSTLFISSVSDYDFVIHLNPRFAGLQSGQKAKRAQFKNLEVKSTLDPNLIGYNPVHSFLKELERLYAGSIVFFHNTDGGAIIAGLWNPLCAPRTFKVNLSYSTMPHKSVGKDEERLVATNRAAILNEIGRLGDDLIVRIDINK
ncbi:MAG: hypothetical protein M1829_000713 [Trizodia sp. TS-e1964]|nr:MAG: hypothetical protein M1829_000713 [Trizodia sp. TS-e1964]